MTFTAEQWNIIMTALAAGGAALIGTCFYVLNKSLKNSADIAGVKTSAAVNDQKNTESIRKMAEEANEERRKLAERYDALLTEQTKAREDNAKRLTDLSIALETAKGVAAADAARRDKQTNDLLSQLNTISTYKAEVLSDLDKAHAENDENKRALEKANDLLKTLQAQRDTDNATALKLRADLDEISRQRTVTQQELERTVLERDTAKNALEAANRMIGAHRDSNRELLARIDSMDKRVEELETKLSELSAKEDQHQAAIRDLTARAERAEAERDALRSQLDAHAAPSVVVENVNAMGVDGHIIGGDTKPLPELANIDGKAAEGNAQ